MKVNCKWGRPVHGDDVLAAGHGHRPARVHHQDGEPREFRERHELIDERQSGADSHELLQLEKENGARNVKSAITKFSNCNAILFQFGYQIGSRTSGSPSSIPVGRQG